MSVCLEHTNVLANLVGTCPSTSSNEDTPPITSSTTTQLNATEQPTSSEPQNLLNTKNIAKLVVAANHSTTGTVLQKVVNPPLITVLNSSGPLTVVKTLCVTSGVPSSPQFTVVNSAPLNVTNSGVGGKPPTITLLNGPVTVVKTISDKSLMQTTPESIQTNSVSSTSNAAGLSSVSSIIENRGHNVFVKNTCPEQDIPQSHKLLTANNFPQNNILNVTQPPINKINGQRNKLKIVSNIMASSSSQNLTVNNNLLLNKSSTTQRYMPRTKLVGPNGTTTKYLNKSASNNIIKSSNIKTADKSSPQRLVYPTHKSQIKTLPPLVNNFMLKNQGIKTLPPLAGSMPPTPMQRTGSGLRTLPPQRPQKVANKPNYIGKHAVQAQKMKHNHHGKMKSMKSSSGSPFNNYHHMPEKQLTFNQALTAEILETLGNKNGTPSTSYSYKNYEIMPSRYESPYCHENKPVVMNDRLPKPMEDKTKSGLDALSLICQAVLLDHNYNATLPPDTTPTKPSPPPPQVNGLSGTSMYSPGSSKRRSLSSSQTTSATSSLSSMSVLPNNVSAIPQEDDAASDVSYGSDRKHDTEGEETDTAPEAEAVNNEQMDHYGDYVTRCICGFLHDDGYMIECDMCKVWQHVQCVVKNKQVPEEYLCEECDPTKPVDKQKARMAQQQWLRDRHFPDLRKGKDAKVKEMLKLIVRETISDSDSSDGEHPPLNNNMITKGRTALSNRRKSDPQKHCTRHRRDSTKDPASRKQVKRRERKIVKRKPKQQQVKSHSGDEEHPDSVSSTPLPQLRQWIENYEEAVTNHYSPELRARISSIRVNGAHSDLQIQLDSSVNKCRVHTQPLTDLKYLVTTVYLPPNTPVVELRGKYMLSTQHRNSGGALTTRQHAQRPGPFLFFYRLHKDNTEVCVDTRTYGNSARFIRRSCKPNAELRHCIEKGVLHLYIVTIVTVDKNMELTIKHESHDLAAIGSTHISCACGNPDNCTVNKPALVKKNGETPEVHRKRRGRRTTSAAALPACESNDVKVKEDPNISETITTADVPPMPAQVKEEPPSSPPVPDTKEEPLEIKEEEKEEVKPEVKKEDIEVKEEEIPEQKPDDVDINQKITEDVVKAEKEENTKQQHSSITTRRSSSHHKNTEKDEKETPSSPTKEGKSQGSKKLSREERKLEAILRAIEQMEKAEQRKQEHQGKQAHRRESEPGPNIKEEEKIEPKVKRRRRKGRSRTTSTNTQNTRRNRLNSTDSYITSGDESLLSPSDSAPPNRPNTKELCNSDNNKDNMLLVLSGDKLDKSPTREDSNSNSAHSSPETPLSSACLLVQAAVEPLEPGFKFPKKVLMNEWLNKVPEPIHSAISISPSSLTPHINSAGAADYEPSPNFYVPGKNISALAQAATFCDSTSNNQAHGSAKKRWLRQAISEDQCDSPTNRPESPTVSEMAAPPKKRRLPRESLSNETSSPPSTPTGAAPQIPIQEEIASAPFHVSESKCAESEKQEGCVEIVYSGTEGDSPSQTLESDTVLKERAAEMKQEFSQCVLPTVQEPVAHQPLTALTCLLDPRLSRDHNQQMFSNCEHLVGTVEKTLSILGFDDRKPDPVTPIKRKLSITEYRQRKKLTNDKSPEEPTSTEENTSESFKPCRPRSNSSSSSSSVSSTDDDSTPIELPGKSSAFNSEPTELERQREISSLRLKKAFGLVVDDEPKKPTLDVEAIINCELPPVIKPSIPLSSPTFPIPGSIISGSVTCSPKPLLNREPESASSSSAVELKKTQTKEQPVTEDAEASDFATINETPPIIEDAKEDELELPPTPVQDELEDVPQEKQSDEECSDEGNIKPNMFYTPDEEEQQNHETLQEEVESLTYVPPFNNPVYANAGFTTDYTSVVDDDARYEGRNPSPPPEMGQT